MKKVIDGKLYNTETATMVASWSNGYYIGDLKHMSEELYQKRTGEYFLYGVGGPMTKYAISCGNSSWSGGDAIIPVTEQAAREWAEEHLDGDEYIKIFGPVPEGDESKKIISASIKLATYDKLKSLAADQRKSMSAIIDDLVAKA